ncbi:hypothetical protein H8N01_25490 [Streptomyces sp. AC536]|uniref:hypothetical protein n=1 Tax=Streptomyces buecherae TaxID=2763006 RepID=UPI00164D3B84|nr:hypothetical protein [Streptomyces buecherae]MBC3985837.1 hypothetical protein [Streptomyces buecherae]QNJ43155.1 hypothetical protein H7H31_28270 [Streptomyces buecherae]
MLDEPRSGRLAAWGNALLAGLVSPDDAAHRITGTDASHRVVDLPERSAPPGAAPDPAPVGLTLAIGRLRALGATGLCVALPVAGHPLGLSGPPEFNARALEAGEAVIAVGVGLGLVPDVHRAGPREVGVDGGPVSESDVHTEVLWRCLPVREAPPADVPSLGEAERELAEALREATEALARLNVAGSGPVAAAALEAYRARAERGREVLAPGYPPRAVRVLELAQRVGALVDIAYGPEHGGAVSASEIAARSEALRPVERTARRAQVAAYNAYVEQRLRQA